MKRPRPQWAIVLLLMSAIPAFPKCATGVYTVTGTIQECCSKNAVKNAKVFVFINNDSAQRLSSSEQGSELLNPHTPETSVEGRFSASYVFSTFKSYSLLFGH